MIVAIGVYPMRFLVLVSLFTSLFAVDSPFLALSQATRDGKIQVTAQNTSGKVIVAYVVLITHSDGASTAVHHGVYSDGDELAAGRVVRIDDLDLRKVSGELKLSVDYVRLADGTTWGDPVTERGKELLARSRE